MDNQDKLRKALWQVYNRPTHILPWHEGGNLPWNDPTFSERMLREHLDESHGAASRILSERTIQIEWLWEHLNLEADASLFDVTCGPGLYAVEFAQRGCVVTGVDFSPVSITYARDLALTTGVSARCNFVQQDVREMDYTGTDFKAAILLYGQLAVFNRQEAQDLLTQIAQSLQVGGKLCLELLAQERVDKNNSTWWFTDNKGLWGNGPFLHLGERFWYAEEELSLERFQIIHLETGHLTEIHLCDQTYSVESMTRMLKQAGFNIITVYEAWDGLDLYDAKEWNIYIAEKSN